MDFFARQETARQHTMKLVGLFVGAVFAVIFAVDLMVMLAAWWADAGPIPLNTHLGLAGFLLLAMFIFAVRRLIKLRGGGEAIAKMVKARAVKRNTANLDERRLLNVVDEMAIASGVAAPTVYVMDTEEGINAFAAGYSPNQAVIVVTQGTLTKLNRDELQGVIGHEFSHILNGDMRLNVRLIGILAGIVIVGEAGLVIIKLAAEANDSGAIPIALWGALVAAVGYIGVFFGRMIKAAVSRQREFLADASSVQFTRNPDGLVSALEKIGKEGTVLASAQAGEMSHMFFSQAIKPKMFSDLFATHPPIDQRIASIRGQPIVATAQTAGGIVDAVLAMVGKSTPEHVDHAMETLAALPASVKKMLETPEGARKVVYGYLFAADEATRLVQVRALVEAGDDLAAGAMDDMTKLLRQIGPAMRLPVLTLAAPALRQMEQPAKNTFLKAVDALIEADNEVTLGEFTLRTLLQRQLAAGSAKMERVKFRDIASVRADLDAILAALKSAASPQEAAKAKFDAKGVGAALDRLRVLAPLAKPKVIEECVKVVLADEQVSAAEMEMLRAIGMAIDCPLPPVIEKASIGRVEARAASEQIGQPA